MTITSLGYAGTISDAEWAHYAPSLGDYGVVAQGDFRATLGSGDREVRIAAGTAFGAGILDESDAQEVVTLGSVSSGSRWDLIVLRRTWGTSTTSVEVVPGSSAKVIPTRDVDPGEVDEQPLWLARVTAGQAAVQDLVDLRVWRGPGGAHAADPLALSYLTSVGTQVRIGSSLWQRVIDASGNPTWVDITSLAVLGIHIGPASSTPPAGSQAWIVTP